jgi:hypothetical protein
MKKNKLKKYTFKFLSIFIAVISAFALSNWNENRNSHESEQKILIEIKNGIAIDTKDFRSNIRGHKISLKANQVFRDLIDNKAVSQDSIGLFYISLFRDYTPLINRSGYESLKAAGLKTITNDSLRLQIITLYDYYYGIIEVLDKVNEMQSFKNYFAKVNGLLHPYMAFDAKGNLKEIAEPTALTEMQRKEILSYLWRLESNRQYKLQRYYSVLQVMQKATDNIEREIQQ